jgi:hypothetical protein
MKVVRLSAPRTGRLYPQEVFQVLIFTTGWVDPRAMERSERMSLKNPMTPPGIYPGTVRLVAQRLVISRHSLMSNPLHIYLSVTSSPSVCLPPGPGFHLYNAFRLKFGCTVGRSCAALLSREWNMASPYRLRLKPARELRVKRAEGMDMWRTLSFV